jgi:hypothetical protein
MNFTWLLLFIMILSFGSSSELKASDANTNKASTTKSVQFGITKAKSDKEEDKTIPNVISDDKKAKEIRVDLPKRELKDRKPGTIAVKPLAINFANLTVGMARKSQLINGYPKDPYSRSFGMLSNQAGAIGTSYDIEFGIMLTSNIEAFTIIGINYQRPISLIEITNNNPMPLFGQFDNFAYSFKSRTNYNFSLGGRYYWNTKKPWFPFIGLMGTAIFQDSIRACVYAPFNPFNPADTWPYVGQLTLQRRKRLYGGTLQVGADYQFTDRIALTLMAGLQYTPRTHMTYTTINGRQISCRDNRNIWNMPIMAALKFTF